MYSACGPPHIQFNISLIRIKKNHLQLSMYSRKFPSILPDVFLESNQYFTQRVRGKAHSIVIKLIEVCTSYSICYCMQTELNPYIYICIIYVLFMLPIGMRHMIWLYNRGAASSHVSLLIATCIVLVYIMLQLQFGTASTNRHFGVEHTF